MGFTFFKRAVEPEERCKPEKCYVGISSSCRGHPVYLAGFFTGDYDDHFTSCSGGLSFSFKALAIDENPNELAKKMVRDHDSGKDTVYLLAMEWSTEELEKQTKQGNFSKGIIRAINACDYHSFGRSPKNKHRITVKTMEDFLKSPRCSR